MSTPPELHEEHVLDDGTPVVLRMVRPSDATELRHGFERLSPSSRYRRFLASRSSLSDETLRYLTCVDGHDHVAIVALTHGPDGAEVGLGIARFIRIEPEVAEAALTVIDDAQGKGLGRILALALARAAVAHGIHRFRGEILATNQPVQQLLEEAGAVVRPSGEGSLVFDVELNPPEPHRLELTARRLLRAAASQVLGLFRGLTGAR
jgi:GNAT superfamily N-acetyltransferase